MFLSEIKYSWYFSKSSVDIFNILIFCLNMECINFIYCLVCQCVCVCVNIVFIVLEVSSYICVAWWPIFTDFTFHQLSRTNKRTEFGAIISVAVICGVVIKVFI